MLNEMSNLIFPQINYLFRNSKDIFLETFYFQLSELKIYNK